MNNKTLTSIFTWNIQYGDNENSELFEDKGIIDYESFINEFNQFPWLDEIKKANQVLQCSPTLTVINNSSGYDLFVSGYGKGDGSDTTFLVGLVCSPSGLFRKRKLISNETISLDYIVEVYDAFFRQDLDLVKKLLEK